MLPTSLTVPVPLISRPPVPLMLLKLVPSVAWSKATVALLTILPCRLEVVPCRTPADTVVPPV
ncbi:hypothetical protein [Reyranella sp.]|uniref:hypothetical protein n=1 Tax=Reyranella sp. TaxID=1929291 RepID=UPI003BAA7EE6